MERALELGSVPTAESALELEKIDLANVEVVVSYFEAHPYGANDFRFSQSPQAQFCTLYSYDYIFYEYSYHIGGSSNLISLAQRRVDPQHAFGIVLQTNRQRCKN
jgi:hypothetical protein